MPPYGTSWSITFQAGAQLSRSFDEAIAHLEGLPATRRFLRTPNQYGYATLLLMPSARWQLR